MKTGVYQIRNILNNKIYIGSTMRYFSQRKAEHFKNLRKGIHSSPILQNSWNKYGEQNFVFEILEHCLPMSCIEKEQYYLDNYHPEYNINPKAKNSAGRKWTYSQRLKCLNPKGIKSFNFSDEYFKFKNVFSGEEVTLSRFEFADKYLIDRSFVSKLCNGKKQMAKNWVCIEKIKV